MNLSPDIAALSTLDQRRSATASAAGERALRTAAAGGDRARIRETAEDFEATFLSQMLSHMFKNIGEGDGLFGGGAAEGVWKSHYLDQVSKSIARSGGIGVAEVVERQLLQLQEVK